MKLLNITNGGGQLAVEVSGEGQLILCVPGMGESRASYRHLTPLLLAAGYRVAIMDLRGHGDSSLDFDSYDDSAAADDLLAIIKELDASNCIVIGNSMGAAAGVLAAAARPEVIEKLILIGPFVRDHGNAASRWLLNLLLMRPWGPTVWGFYYKSLFGQPRANDHVEHISTTLALLRRPGRWRAFKKTTQTSHALAESALPKLVAKTLIIMGDNDRDFKDPAAEASWIAAKLNGKYLMIPGAGHYPMGEQAHRVFDAIHPFLIKDASHG